MEDNRKLLIQLKAMGITVTEKNYNEYVRQGYAILVKLYDLGLTQEQVYQSLIQYHRSLKDGIASDFIADIMDFVVGWCAPQWHIWRDDGKFDRSK